MVSLRELLTPVSRPETVHAQKSYHILGAHWYAQGLYTKDVTSGAGVRASVLYRVEQGDFVYNRLFAWKGSFAVANKESHGCYVSNEFPCFAVNASRLDAQFLWRYFSRSSIWDEALAESTGGTPTSRNRLKEGKFLAFKIPLPPLDEQRRIVARIEQLAAKIQEARDLRFQSNEKTKTLLATETTKLFEDLRARYRNRLIRELGECGENPVQTGPFGAQLHSSEYVNEGVPVLNVGNVWPEGLCLDRLDHVLPEKASRLDRYSVKTGDLLFARSGATLGKVCLVPAKCDGWLMSGHLFRVRFDQGLISSRFAFAALRGARSIHDQVFGQVRGATRPGYNTTLLGNIRLPLPPPPEQRRIVASLDDLQAKVDALKRLQAETAAELDALLPSILDKAFKGDL
jgi:type I restriction enzyme S subunit